MYISYVNRSPVEVNIILTISFSAANFWINLQTECGDAIEYSVELQLRVSTTDQEQLRNELKHQAASLGTGHGTMMLFSS